MPIALPVRLQAAANRREKGPLSAPDIGGLSGVHGGRVSTLDRADLRACSWSAARFTASAAGLGRNPSRRLLSSAPLVGRRRPALLPLRHTQRVPTLGRPDHTRRGFLLKWQTRRTEPRVSSADRVPRDRHVTDSRYPRLVRGLNPTDTVQRLFNCGFLAGGCL